MNPWNRAVATLCVAVVSGISPVRAAERRCSLSPNLVGACFTFHGRLGFSNGTPDCRIWRVGTKRILGVLDPSESDQYNENPTLPRGVECYPGTITYADFTVCPFTKERAGEMQMVCVESASNVFAIRYATICELLADPARFDRGRVEVHGTVGTDGGATVITDKKCSASVLFVADPSLQADRGYERLRDLMTGQRPVEATFVGRYFADGPKSRSQNALRSRLIVQSVSAVESTPPK